MPRQSAAATPRLRVNSSSELNNSLQRLAVFCYSILRLGPWAGGASHRVELSWWDLRWNRRTCSRELHNPPIGKRPSLSGSHEKYGPGKFHETVEVRGRTLALLSMLDFFAGQLPARLCPDDT